MNNEQIISIYNSIITIYNEKLYLNGRVVMNKTYDKIQLLETYFRVIYPVFADPQTRDLETCAYYTQSRDRVVTLETCVYYTQAMDEVITLIKTLVSIIRSDYSEITNRLDIVEMFRDSTIRCILNYAQMLNYEAELLKYKNTETQNVELKLSNDQLLKNISDLTEMNNVIKNQLKKLTNDNQELITHDKNDKHIKFTISIPPSTNLVTEINEIKTYITTNTEKVVDVMDNTKVKINDHEYVIVNPSMPHNPTNSTNYVSNTVKIIKGESIIINGMFQSIAHTDLDAKLFDETSVTLSAGTKLRDDDGMCIILCEDTFAIIQS